MKTTYMWIRIVALCLVLLLPLFALPLLSFATPAVYGDTFVGALPEKFDRLTSTDEPKVILVGGSSVAFGYDSALIEEVLGMPVVNFGLYADLGTKLMMDLSRAGIGKGDIVLFAPELDEQTMSLYFNSDTTLKAVEGDASMLWRLPPDDLFKTLGSMFNFASDKLGLLAEGKTSQGSGIYDARYFNVYGDVDGSKDLNGDGEADFPRAVNAMPAYYDASHPIVLSADTVDEEFIEYVKDYKAFCERRGATFYYTYCPMNALSLYYDTDSEEAEALESLLRTSLGEDCFVGDLESFVYEPGYFYDSNLHLNASGVTMHTVHVLNELLFAMEDYQTVVPVTPPPAPDLPESNIVFEGEDDENCVYFTFEFATEYSSALGMELQLGYRITGLSELGKQQTTLTIPTNYNGYRVTLLGEDALSGGVCQTLILPKAFDDFAVDASVLVFTFEENCLRGAGSQLEQLHLYVADCANILPPDKNGAQTPFVIHVPKTSDYNNGYFWSQFLKQFTIVHDLS